MQKTLLIISSIALLISGCTVITKPEQPIAKPTLTPVTGVHRDLANLPLPVGKIVAAVYGFRDQSGQFKPSPDSNLSTSVTQGGASILLKAMRDSRWFIPVEREGLQDLLTERKVARALEVPSNPNVPQPAAINLPPLAPASILLEGGIVAYESNVRTGGKGVNYLGIGVNEQYRVDQVTVNLRAVDVRTGQIINSVSTTKTIYSQQVNSNIYRFIGFKELLQAEAGYTRNEPAQLCVSSAIEAALVQLILQGARDGVWQLQNPSDLSANSLFPAYLNEVDEQLRPADEVLKEEAARAKAELWKAH